MDNLDSPSDEDDDDSDNPLPKPRVWRQEDRLNPAPPACWLVVFTYPRHPRAIVVGCWLLLVTHFQEAEKLAGLRLQMVARDADGDRVLLVHPSLAETASEWIEIFNSNMTGGCNCGGYCLEPDGQKAAMRVFARRAWPRLAEAARIDLLIEGEADDIGMALDDSPDFSDIEDIFILERIAEEGA